MQIFNVAGKECEISESTIKSWISGSRHCKATRYFRDRKFNNSKNLFKFFRKRPENKLRKLQEIFRDYVGTDSAINTETNNLDVFCWSLVNKFIDLLEFQRIDDIPTDTPFGNRDNRTSNPLLIYRRETTGPSLPSNPKHFQLIDSCDTVFEESVLGFQKQLRVLAQSINEKAKEKAEADLKKKQVEHRKIGLDKFLI